MTRCKRFGSKCAQPLSGAFQCEPTYPFGFVFVGSLAKSHQGLKCGFFLCGLDVFFQGFDTVAVDNHFLGFRIVEQARRVLI